LTWGHCSEILHPIDRRGPFRRDDLRTELGPEHYPTMNHSRVSRILFLEANPNDRDSVESSFESKEIDMAIRKSNFRDYIEFRPKPAVELSKIQPAVNRESLLGA
jgi:hypothetical protein